jgi:hypothetical protein
MPRPLIGIDNEVREMTEEEYADLLATGWTHEETQTQPFGHKTEPIAE